MGSAVAGVKAGGVAAAYFAGSITLFNILLLLAFKQQVLTYLSQNFPSSCPLAQVSGSTGTAVSCFTSLLLEEIPVADFLRTLLVAVLFGLAICMYFDYLPGPTYLRRTVLGSLIMIVAMLFLGLYGLVTSQVQAVLMIAFECAASIPYAAIIARLYRRFTREVEFKSADPAGRIMVDRRDVTGRKRTFTLNSSHKVEAAGELKTFKSWHVSGGVTVEEPKQRKSSFRVSGDGLLRLG